MRETWKPQVKGQHTLYRDKRVGKFVLVGEEVVVVGLWARWDDSEVSLVDVFWTISGRK
jgi:hypothetical protein